MEPSSASSKAVVAHGLAMWLSLGVLLGVGMVLGRLRDCSKCTATSGKRRALSALRWATQVFCLILATAGIAFAGVFLWDPRKPTPHGILGLATFCCFLLYLLTEGLQHCAAKGSRLAKFWVALHRTLGPLLLVPAAAANATGFLKFPTTNLSERQLVFGLCVVQAVWSATVAVALVCIPADKGAPEVLPNSKQQQQHPAAKASSKQQEQLKAGTPANSGAEHRSAAGGSSPAVLLNLDTVPRCASIVSGSDFFDLALDSPVSHSGGFHEDAEEGQVHRPLGDM